MATIHSLPPEILRDILALAYPARRKGSRDGLRSTALVHSTWRAPSQSILTEALVFGPVYADSTRLFIEHGPARFVGQFIGFQECSNELLEAVLGRAEPNTIRDFALYYPAEAPPADLFQLESLQYVRTFELRTDTEQSVPACGLLVNFTSFPTRLEELHLIGTTVPVAFVAASATTLTHLQLGPNNEPLLNHPTSLAPRLTQLSTLLLYIDGAHKNLPLSTRLAPFIARLPALASLTLLGPSPHQLERLVAALPSLPTLRTLATGLMQPRVARGRPGAPRQPTFEGVKAELVPALQRCARSALVRGLAQWKLDLSIPEDDDDQEYGHVHPTHFQRWETRMPGWSEFTGALRAANVELLLGPFHAG